jgi:hypothetical protein
VPHRAGLLQKVTMPIETPLSISQHIVQAGLFLWATIETRR